MRGGGTFNPKTCIHADETYFHLGAVEVEVVVDDVVDGGVGLGVVVGEGRPDERKVGGEQVCWKDDIILRRGGGSVIIIIITIDERKVDFLQLHTTHARCNILKSKAYL